MKAKFPQYYVKNSHEAIISPEVYDLVQAEIKKRAESNYNYSCVSPFSSRIICGECGNCYGSKVWHSNDKYRKVIWQCNKKFKNKEKCKTPYLTENQIKEEFVKAFNTLISNKDEVIKDCENTILSLTNTDELDAKIAKIQEGSEILVGMMRNLIQKNSRKAINQDGYNEKYNAYTEKYEKIKIFIDDLKNNDIVITEFDEKLWYSLVEKAVVYTDGKMEFKFKNSN